MTDEAALTRALAAIDAAHAADPVRSEGRPAELAYAERVAHWVSVLVPDPTPALRLAARAQHLERWAIPRADFPLGRSGYLQWRKAIQQRQGRRATEILGRAGCAPALAARVAKLVAKATPRDDPEGQVLEDAACLVFLERELATFAAQHRDYPRAKLIDILQKTWARMSPRGRECARTLPLAPALRELVSAAVGTA